MRRKIIEIFAVALLSIILSLTYTANNNMHEAMDNLALSFFAQRVTPEKLKAKYKMGTLNVLIVPGHDNSSSGTFFMGLKESDLNVELAHYVFDLFLEDPKFNVLVLRDENGNYNSWFSQYMNANRVAIEEFRSRSRQLTQYAKDIGGYKDVREDVIHNPAADNASINLYGVNKFANDNNIDIVLHIHFNDYPGRPHWSPGKYSGFAIYVPQAELPNSLASTELAYFVKDELESFIAPSNFLGEQKIVVPDQELIAVGSNASRDSVSLLVEYDYIYESQYHESGIRGGYLNELALLTYNGIKKYYDDVPTADTALLPHKWGSVMKKKDKGLDVLAMQAALNKEGVYPPQGRSLKSCPLSGYYGACTEAAVKEFQEKYKESLLGPLGLSSGTGFAGKKTIETLNTLYK